MDVIVNMFPLHVKIFCVGHLMKQLDMQLNHVHHHYSKIFQLTSGVLTDTPQIP